MSARPHWVELHDDEPADLAGTVHYLDADPVRVHRADPLAPSWTCTKHGADAMCEHVLAVALTERARDVLTIPDPDPQTAGPQPPEHQHHHEGETP